MDNAAQCGAGSTGLTALAADDVRAAVERILASAGFASAPRRSRLLRFLVEETLAGRGEALTEYGIGLDVFERFASFDPRIDSIVRTEVSRLRQKLRGYYAPAECAEPVLIEIPSRTYVPVISTRESKPAEKPSSAADAVPKARRAMLWAIFALCAIAVAAAALIAASLFASPPATSLVVLPFLDYSANGNAEYLADGITEELTNQLAQRRELRVVARTSAFAFKGKGVDIREIGRKLNAGAELEGSLSRDGDTVRVTAQLNRTSDGYHLWSRSFEAPYRDIAFVETQIAQSVEAVVLKRAAPQAAAPVADAEAHDLYLRASFQLSRQTPDAMAKSLELFQGAVAKDPAYVNAYRGIARAEIALIHITAAPPMPAFARARQALERALEIDPGDAEALGQMADIDYIYDWDWPRAERQFELAVERGAQATTRSYFGWGLATRGRFDEARRQFEIAQDLDPLGAGPRFNQAMAFLLEHRFEDARRIFRESIDSNTSVLDAHLMLGVLAVYQRHCPEADGHFEWFAQHFASPMADFGLALNAACAGRNDEARAFIAKAEAQRGGAFASPYQLAMAHAYVGEKDRAIEDLERSAEAREGQIFYIKYDPAFDGIRGDPRFAALEKKVGLN